MRNAVHRELLSAPPRYDVKPARFALNQDSRKLCSGGVTCPGLIRCTGLEQLHVKKLFCPWFIIAQLLYLQYLSGVSSLQMGN